MAFLAKFLESTFGKLILKYVINPILEKVKIWIKWKIKDKVEEIKDKKAAEKYEKEISNPEQTREERKKSETDFINS